MKVICYFAISLLGLGILLTLMTPMANSATVPPVTKQSGTFDPQTYTMKTVGDEYLPLNRKNIITKSSGELIDSIVPYDVIHVSHFVGEQFVAKEKFVVNHVLFCDFQTAVDHHLHNNHRYRSEDDRKWLTKNLKEQFPDYATSEFVVIYCY